MITRMTPPLSSPTRVRYEIRIGGRLLKVTEQVGVTTGMHAERDGTEFVDGQYWWVVDNQQVAVDVALAMLRDAGEQP